MEYIVELNNKKYAIELLDSKATILSVVDIWNDSNTMDIDNEPVGIPDLEFNDRNEIQIKKTCCISASMPGMILRVLVKEADLVKKGDIILVCESMKMENEIVSQTNGRVNKIYVNDGDKVKSGDKLVEII